MFDLNNKTILVTGASSGIGRAAAILCDSLGATVVLSGRNLAKLKTTAESMSSRSSLLTADLSLPAETEKLCSDLPALDAFIHCAGIIQPLPVKYITEKHIAQVFNINFNSAALMSSGLLRTKKLKEGASVVFVSSVSAAHPYTGGSLYTSSKAALEAFARGLALEVASKKIRVNTVAPALVRTGILTRSEEIYSAEEIEAIENRYPLGIGTPGDVARMLAFLAGPASSWITGNVITMDGGLLLNSK